MKIKIVDLGDESRDTNLEELGEAIEKLKTLLAILEETKQKIKNGD